jgi:hypothetical protein
MPQAGVSDGTVGDKLRMVPAGTDRSNRMLTSDSLGRRSRADRPVVPVRANPDRWSAARRTLAREARRVGASARRHAVPRRIDHVAEYLLAGVVLLVSLTLIAMSLFLAGTVLSWTRSEDVAAEAEALRNSAVAAGVRCDGWVPGETQVVLGVMNSADGRCIVSGTGVALRFEAFVRSHLDGDHQAGFPPGASGACPWLEGPGLLVHPVMAERMERQQWVTQTEAARAEVMTVVQGALGGTLHPC